MNLTNFSFPSGSWVGKSSFAERLLTKNRKLETVLGDVAFIGNNKMKDISLPSLVNVTGAGLIDGHFDS